MSTEFKAGDIVELKSGGPPMTVAEVKDDMMDLSYVRCVWFAGAKREGANFKPETLVHHKSNEK